MTGNSVNIVIDEDRLQYKKDNDKIISFYSYFRLLITNANPLRQIFYVIA